jgi:hypothetical protein
VPRRSEVADAVWQGVRVQNALDDAARPWTGLERGWASALVVLLTVLLALWGAFLVPFRVGGTLVPVSILIAVVGNVLVGRAAARLAGSSGPLLTGVLWVGLTLVLSSRRAEGDVVVPGSSVGMAFLAAGALASAVAYGAAVLRPAASPARR